MKKPPTIAIVGRPNVGKSTLFNAIVGRRKAITECASGTTRDRLHSACTHADRSFSLVDTGGFISKPTGGIQKQVSRQISQAIAEANALIFVCDAQSGLAPLDFEMADQLRKSDKPVFLAVNKADNNSLKEACVDFYRLGLDTPYPVSALHRSGIKALLDEATAGIGKAGQKEEPPDIKLAIVGRPNAGKSSMLNRIINEDRVIVDDMPGTTRDSLDSHFRLDDKNFLLIDTAGIRHKKRLKDSATFYGVARSYQAIRRSDVCAVLIDAFCGPKKDDFRILDYIIKEEKGCILVVNKWDLIKNVTMHDYEVALKKAFGFMDFAPCVFASALTGRNALKVLKEAAQIFKRRQQRHPVKELNDFLTKIKQVKFVTQIGIDPPHFLIFTSDVRAAKKESNFIKNRLREKFDLNGTPIILNFRRHKKD